MQYITIKRFERHGIDGHFNIPYGTRLEKRDDGILYYDNHSVCVSSSAAAHEYFACDHDGQGIKRGKLSHAIIKRLAPQNFNSMQERDEYWQIIWNDPLAQKYRRSEHVTYWLWNDDFYNAPIEDLEYISKLVGVKKGMLEDV